MRGLGGERYHAASPTPPRMLFAKYVFVVLHIVTAAAFFGIGLSQARQARAFAASRLDLLGEQGARSAMLMTVFAVLTVAFAFAAFYIGNTHAYQAGGAERPFSFYGSEYHWSLMLLLGLIAVHVLLVQRGWAQLRNAVATGGLLDGPRKRIAAGSGVSHLLWLVILVLMFWGNLRVGLMQL